ncbi:MAG: asparagine synthase (glutamine-hydrolyzing) [Bacilli bacterium]|nr:asparagine synthase (glutamine-hydrolyzing) [Bacilli bacterium]
MCGFVGWHNIHHETKNKKIIKKMNNTLKRRGPDQKGYFYSEKLLLGHRRLSIIDLKKGKQPMSYKGYTICYNGELYNTEEIKNKLKDKYEFTTTSDTEVLLKGFIEYKEKILEMIEGIFAFCIYYEDKIFLARDRVGVKPLFYSKIKNDFIFSSEIKAILKSKIVKPIINTESLQELLSLSPSRIPGSGIFKDIKELRAGHYMIYDGNIKIKRYWNIQNKKCNDTFEEAVTKVRKLLDDSIKRQMVSDVSIACLLSGGLDSSIISAICSNEYKKNNQKLDTYSIDYEDNEKYFQGNKFQVSRDNEYISLMSKEFSTRHHYKVISQKKLAKYLKYSVLARDLPGMADIDSSLLWFSKKIACNYKVILSGECADEIFGGYPWFYRENVMNREYFPWLDSINSRVELLKNDLKEKLNLKEFMKQQYDNILKEVPKVKDKKEQKYKNLFYLNMTYFMATLLERKDRMTMYASLEARVPFADTKLIEYLWNIPWKYKFHNEQEKGLLREAYKDLLPLEVTYRKKNPYPKTHNPKYAKIVSKLLKKRLKNKNSILYKIFDKEALIELIETKGLAFKEPWFGQLMTGPQLLAFLYQIDIWATKYKIILDIN